MDGVYFTDPSFGAPMPFPQGKMGVYYVDPKGKVVRLIDNLNNPNGILLSPDEKTLYVIPTGPADMMAYPVEGPGKIGKGKVFCTLKGPEGNKGSGGDGATIDTKGNLYITSSLGLQVFNPDGKLLGVIACAGPNCGRICCRNNGVRISRSRRAFCRIVENFGEEAPSVAKFARQMWL